MVCPKYFQQRQKTKVLKSHQINNETSNDPKFIERFGFDRIDSEVITSNAILHKRAKITDLVSAYIIGFSLKLLRNEKTNNQIINSVINITI